MSFRNSVLCGTASDAVSAVKLEIPTCHGEAQRAKTEGFQIFEIQIDSIP